MLEKFIIHPILMMSNTSKINTFFIYKILVKSTNWIEQNEPIYIKSHRKNGMNLKEKKKERKESKWDDEHKLDEKTKKQISVF